MMKMTTVEARENFSDLINKAAYGSRRIVLTRRGKPLAAIVPLADLEQLSTQHMAAVNE
ncbi:MAG: type II toxin-antitoxin system Phd/YefM family antitoxin [Gammaproteobacteria bacterium]|nr:type II toxin-antitoxin system Phd/YefM family antitoxin [Gammaproteobacteria bacterium]